MRRFVVAVLLVTACFAGGLASGSAVVRAAHASNPYAGLDTLARALTTIERQYVEPIAEIDLVYDAIEGMLDHLDPHSTFLRPDAWAALQERTEGRFLGIGVELDESATRAVVLRVVRDSPADRAGVRAGDEIVRIDGEDVRGLPGEEVGRRLAGERGTPVKLGLLRGDPPRPVALTVIRDTVIEHVVDGVLLQPGRALVRIEHFQRHTVEELDKVLRDLEAEGGEPLAAIILDLRGDPGGLLDEAVGVVDLFVKEGTIVRTVGRDGQVLEAHEARDSGQEYTARLVVLVDQQSASAAEIVAGALQDLHRATLVGTRTYGKGSVQQVYEFEDGSAMKLTVARYVLPSGRTIADRQGLEPDVPVNATPDDAAARLRRRIGELAIPDDERAALLADLDAALHPAEATEAPLPSLHGPGDPLDTDPFVRRGWELLQAGG